MGKIEAPVFTTDGALNRLSAQQQRLFRALHHINLNFYPFTLQGEAYLRSRWKQGLDLVVGIAASPPALLIAGAAAILMKLESPHKSSFINQRRYGQDNTEFLMWKIRSQTNNTEGTGVISPSRIGAVLRKLSIDELPQLFNIFKGEMSFVGRRPPTEFDLRQFEKWMLIHLPYKRAQIRFGFTDEEWRNGKLPSDKVGQIEKYADAVRQVTAVRLEQFRSKNPGKPGLTGLYQIMGRRHLPHHQRLKLDLFYDKNASLGFDISIILGTASAVLTRRGAV